MERTIEMWNGMVFGEKVSEYGLMRGWLDYGTLSRIVGDSIYNSMLRDNTPYEWEQYCGIIDYDNCGFSDYIITERAANFLKDYTNEVVFYNDRLNVYIWGIDRWGTNWDAVSTGIVLVEENV